MSAQHATFTIERKLDFPPAKVFNAWADPNAKERWFGPPSDVKTENREQNFHVGGRDRLKGSWPSGMVSEFSAEYWDIVPNARIVYVYEMHLNGKKISVSLATVQFVAEGKGTRMIVTEQGVFLDGYDDAGSREHGTNQLMDKLAASLAESVQ
jgi:uncharacterized protein YndB with AHSA1/START domain